MGLMEIEEYIRYPPLAVGLMEIENLFRYPALAVGLKPSASQGEAACAGCSGLFTQRPQALGYPRRSPPVRAIPDKTHQHHPCSSVVSVSIRGLFLPDVLKQGVLTVRRRAQFGPAVDECRCRNAGEFTRFDLMETAAVDPPFAPQFIAGHL
jgi:hypothetical protein